MYTAISKERCEFQSNIHIHGGTICRGLIAARLLWIFTLRLSGEIQLYLFLSVGTDAQWRCQAGKKRKRKGKCLFSKTRDNSDSLDRSPRKQTMTSQVHQKPGHPCEHHHWEASLPGWLMVLKVDQINSAAVHSAWRPDICWMTGCYALLVFPLGSSSFLLFHGAVKDMDFSYDSCLSVALKCVLV